jgi:hypothetical protein
MVASIWDLLVTLWASLFGALAQLVERFHGMEEVRGSIPLSSTPFAAEGHCTNRVSTPSKHRDPTPFAAEGHCTNRVSTPSKHRDPTPCGD